MADFVLKIKPARRSNNHHLVPKRNRRFGSSRQPCRDKGSHGAKNECPNTDDAHIMRDNLCGDFCDTIDGLGKNFPPCQLGDDMPDVISEMHHNQTHAQSA